MFKKDFVWGAATASAQIEGAYLKDGKSLSIWDMEATYKNGPLIFNNNTNHLACDHYNKFKEDVKLMKQIGLKAYRFSISWSRLMPDGVGKLNEKGVKFYNDLIDELIKNDIEPYITLYHWDYPQILMEKGGWINSDSINWFAEYAKQCILLFSDRVKYFMTFNEPECFVNLGFVDKRHAPYYDVSDNVLFEIQHNVLKANGLAIKKMRKHAKQDIKIGLAFAQGGSVPISNKEEDIEAAKNHFFDNSGDEFWGNWFVNTIITGKYDERKLKRYNINKSFSKEEMELIKQPIDFIGVNEYMGTYIKASTNKAYEIVPFSADTDFTQMMWPIVDDCLYWTCKFLYEKYNLPIYITENGISLSESPNDDGEIIDDSRITYIKNHLKGLKIAINEGIDIRGYFYWSLMDNFEWTYGYSRRFGLIRVNFETLERTLKKSAYWYGNLIKTNGTEI